MTAATVAKPPGGEAKTLTTVAATAADHLVGNLFFNFGALAGVAGKLHPDDLPEGNARVVYTEMCRLFRDGRLSAGTLEGALKAQGFAYTQYAMDLGQRVMVDSLTQLNDYAETILNWAEVQTLKRTAAQLLAEADQPAVRAYSLYPRLVQPPQRRMAGGLRDISEFGSDLLSDLDAWEAGTAEEGLSTGFAAMDAFFRLEKERLHVLAARPSMGKTSAAMQIGENVAVRFATTHEPGAVAVFSAEMSGKSLALRMAAGGAGVNTQRLKRREATKDEYAKVRREVRRISDLGIKIDDSPSPSPEAMYYKLAMLNAEIPVALVIFDFIELGNPDDKDKRTVTNEELRVSSIAKGLKELAKALKAPVLALSQLSRKVEERRDKLPMLSDLRYSGMLEQAADVVSFIMRPEYYLKRNMTCYLDPSLGSPDLGLDHPHGQNIAYSIVAKQRDGNVGMLPMSFIERYTRFGNLTYLN